MAKKARLIYNPSSGKEEIKRRLPHILELLERGGIETSTHATVGAGDASWAADDAVKRGFDIIVSAGGDGTLNEIVSGIAGKDDRPQIGILPFGTTNDVARALGIPRSTEAACELIVSGSTKRIDIGKMNNRYFINIAAGGSLTELTYEVPSKLKTVIGQMAYYVKGLEKLPRLRPIHVNLRMEERILHEDIMLFLIANSRSVGGIELAPKARMDDGLFDVFILRKCNLAEFIRIVSLAMRGEHLQAPQLEYFQSRYIEVSSPDYVQLNMDGEFGGTLPVQCMLLPSHIEVFTDPGGKLKY